jgi:hypothetical protein
MRLKSMKNGLFTLCFQEIRLRKLRKNKSKGIYATALRAGIHEKYLSIGSFVIYPELSTLLNRPGQSQYSESF